jgi:predicted DNA-binding transcriptional regulator AlpA
MPLAKSKAKELGLLGATEVTMEPSEIARIVAEVASERTPADTPIAEIPDLIQETLRRMRPAVRAVAEAIYDRVRADREPRGYKISIAGDERDQKEPVRDQGGPAVPPAEHESPLLTKEQAARIFGVSTKTLTRWSQSGGFVPRHVLGSRRAYYLKSDIEEALRQGGSSDSSELASDSEVPESVRKVIRRFSQD